MKTIFKNDISIVLAGEAGQGVQSIESIVTSILKKSGYNIFAVKEYMSRVRGGVNSIELRVSSRPVCAFVNRIDILIPLIPEAIPHLKKRISADTVIIGEKSIIGHEPMIDLPINKIAESLGNVLYANSVAVGALCRLLNIDETFAAEFTRSYFANKTAEVIENNIKALQKGYEAGNELSQTIEISIPAQTALPGEIMTSGADAVALGAIAGGCNYVCGYPMSPSTTVLEGMARYSREFDILVEQIEDEVGVVNMALGAWYAGARALVTTSGGGFTLMMEGISLAGMIESPLVIHLAQRPGPATGLPTRTEQGDLNLALYAGHGDFPRILLAPGSLEDGFYLTQNAFNLSDKYQVPVFILTDQYFVDSYYNTKAFDPNHLKNEYHIVETKAAYQRFQFTDTGISPRGIPGFGNGYVCVDSDEHDESGHITEDTDLRTKMVLKRNAKLTEIQKIVPEPYFYGTDSYEILVISWGSTRGILTEAIEALKDKRIALLHFSWIYPLHHSINFYLKNAKTVIAAENNFSCQFAQLITASTGFTPIRKINKYDGLPFSVEEIMSRIKEIIK